MNDDNLWNNAYNTYGGNMRIDSSKFWKEEMYDVRRHIAGKTSSSMDATILRELRRMIEKPKQKTKEDRVVDIVKGGFEQHFNMSIQEFQELYEEMVKTSPEKLV